MFRSPHRGTFLALTCVGLSFPSAVHAQTNSPRFELTFTEAVRAEPTTGRLYIALSRSERDRRGREREPRFQIGRTGVPFFGVDVEGMKHGDVAVIDASAHGSPVVSLNDIPPGEYFVQAMLNVYTKMERSDGHVVWMPKDHWEGQRWVRSPGNGLSAVKKIRIDAQEKNEFQLVVDQVVPPISFPKDTEMVKRFRLESPLISDFWGVPMHLGATVLLPKGYDENPDVSYPVVYLQGHFSTRAPYSHGPESQWMSDDFPRMIAVTFQHPCPYFDDSYAVNSANVGPYGDAIMQELIPEVERRFRVIREPYARVLTGGSTGGWEAVALQVWNPEFFGGAFAFAPDPLDFRNVEGIDIYADENAYYKTHEWRKVPIANTRHPRTEEIVLTSRQRNHFELAHGTKGRSGQQLDIWSAVYGPVGEDGYFKPLFDKLTGEMDPEVAEHWRKYDIRQYLETNWKTVGPKLVGKLHIYCGRQDNFFLNQGVYYLEQFLEKTKDPHYAGSFHYGPRGSHGWRPFRNRMDLLRTMADHIAKNAPAGEDPSSWRY